MYLVVATESGLFAYVQQMWRKMFWSIYGAK